MERNLLIEFISNFKQSTLALLGGFAATIQRVHPGVSGEAVREFLRPIMRSLWGNGHSQPSPADVTKVLQHGAFKARSSQCFG